LIVNTVREAQGMSATLYVHGYFDRRNGPGRPLHFEIAVEDAARRAMNGRTSVDGDLLAASDSTARLIDGSARPFSTSNAAAAEAWGKHDYERAVSLDPDFGAAWLVWVQSLAESHDSARASAIAARALSRPSLRTNVCRAQIEVAAAAVREDQSARASALTELMKLVPNDPTLPRSLAEAELRARHFPEAARALKQTLRMEPANVAAMNLLGYAYALAGDMDAAQKAFEEYRRQPGQEANALDSLGEAFFLNGQFSQAEKLFLEAHAKNHALLQGGDLAKAAYARWLTGDLTAADEIMKRYFDFRGQQGDLLVPWRRATWLYATGRSEKAFAALADASGPALETARRQFAIWRNPSSVVPPDLKVLERAYYQSVPPTDGGPRVFYAQGLLKAGQPEEARKLLKLWPLPENPRDPLLDSLVFTKYLELTGKLR
jgi:Flp pilus assembly protein TadD